MLGYICPCCEENISIAKPRTMRDCPSCKASVVEQKQEREIHRRADALKARLNLLIGGGAA